MNGTPEVRERSGVFSLSSGLGGTLPGTTSNNIFSVVYGSVKSVNFDRHHDVSVLCTISVPQPDFGLTTTVYDLLNAHPLI